MGVFTCQTVINKVEVQLMDEGNDRWDAADLFGWLKSGQRQIVIFKPDAYVLEGASGALDAGTQQDLPTGGIQLIDITHNLGTDGSTPGAAIQCVQRKDMDVMNPDWRSDTASATVQCYMFDPRNPTKYDVYPAQPTSSQGQVNRIYSTTPPDPSTIDSVITLDDIYEPMLIDYILYRAYAMDSAQSLYANQRSTIHWNMFVQSLGRKDLKEQMDNPRPK